MHDLKVGEMMNDVSVTNLLPPPILSFSSSFGPSASKKLSLFSVSCAGIEGEESGGERIENCVDDAYVAVCLESERLHSWAVIVTVLHTLSEEVADKFEVCHLVWHSSAAPPTPLYVCNPVCTAERFCSYKDNAKFSW